MNYQPLWMVDGLRMEKIYQSIKIFIATIVLATISSLSYSQACYQPLHGPNISVGASESSGLCITQLCLGAQYADLQKITNSNSEDYYEFNNLLSLLNVSGVGVRNETPSFNYPINTYFGFKIGVGANSLLDVNLLGNYYLATYKDGSNTPEEIIGLWSLLQSSALMPGQKIAYITAKASKEFDEIRLYTTNLANVQANLRIYHAYAFEGNCNEMNNTFCEQMIQGNHAKVMYNGSLLTVGGNLMNAENLTNGYKLDYAVLKTPANLAGSVFVSILDTKHTIKGGRRVGFIIEPETGNEVLNTNALSAITISTYLHGTLQESHVAFNASSNALLDINLFSTTGGGKIKVAFTTNPTKNFNEVRITVGSLANVGLTGGLRIYGAFSEQVSCGECSKYFNTTLNAQATIKSSSGFGIPVLNPNQPDNIIDGNLTNYASLNGLLTASGTVRVGTTNNQVMNAGDYVGFEIGTGTSLLNVGLFNGLKVKTYLNNSMVEEISSSGLIGASLLSASNKSIAGFKTNFPFDAWELVIDGGLTINLGSAFRIYNPIYIKDSDNDGIADCNDFSSSCNDAYDHDGNGIPDGCDQADMISKIELISNVTYFRPGDTLVYKITIQNNGPQSAQNITILNKAPSQSENISWTATVTGSGLTLPATSGTGTIDHSFSVFPNAVTITYTVNVLTNNTYNLPDIVNNIVVTTQTSDPDPACVMCSTPGLPKQNHPDLVSTAFVLSSNFQFPNNLVKNIGFHVQEINGSATDSIITLVIPKNVNYTVTFNNATNSFSGYPMDNANWNLTDDANNYYLSSNVNNNISGNGYKSIVVQFNYNTNNALPEFSRINYVIAPNSGRERNIENNSQVIDFKLN